MQDDEIGAIDQIDMVEKQVRRSSREPQQKPLQHQSCNKTPTRSLARYESAQSQHGNDDDGDSATSPALAILEQGLEAGGVSWPR